MVVSMVVFGASFGAWNGVDAYATLSFVLGRTGNIAGAAIVTNLASRPAPVLARTVTSLSALSGGRVVLGIGASFLWDQIVTLGVPRLDPGTAVGHAPGTGRWSRWSGS